MTDVEELFYDDWKYLLLLRTVIFLHKIKIKYENFKFKIHA